MAEPNHLVAFHCAAPQRAILRPSLRVYENALDEAFRYPPDVRSNGQVNVDQCIRGGESLPGRGNTAKAVNDPLVLAEEVGVYLQVLVMRNLAATDFVLDCIQWI